MLFVGIPQGRGSQPYGWRSTNYVDFITVAPIGELHLRRWCWCLPTVEVENGVPIWVHYALDGRE